MKRITKISLLLFLVLFYSSCATLFKGTTEEVRFSSEPQRAEVWVNSQRMGETPLVLKLECKKTYTIEFRKEGFKPVIRTITSNVGAG